LLDEFITDEFIKNKRKKQKTKFLERKTVIIFRGQETELPLELGSN
jgi:hypothetical protein